jgi:tRNA1Val (adenine37-N6)-methyltransferase
MKEQVALFEMINRNKEENSEIPLDFLEGYGLTIIQPKDGHRFSVDSLLLADFASPAKGNVIDLGTGCGIIPLVMARRGAEAFFTAIDFNRDITEIARQNVEINGLGKQITLLETDILDLSKHLQPESFDLVISNPPYRKAGTGKVSPKTGRDKARHESTATLSDFLTISKKLVKPGGRICFIYHTERITEFINEASSLKLPLKRLQMVHGTVDAPAKMFMAELCKGKQVRSEVLRPIILFKNKKNDYTKELVKICGGGK